MTDAMRPMMAVEIEQKAEEVRRLPSAIRRIRHRQHVRQMSKAPSTAGGRRRPLADDGSRIHDRASMLLAAEVRVASAPAQSAVIRNISATGLMVEMEAHAYSGDFVSANLGNLGWTDGTVVWRVGNRFGIRFDEQIDPANVRRTIRSTPRAYERTTPLRIF